MGLFGFILFVSPLDSWKQMFVSFPRLGKFSAISSSSKFSCPILSFFSFSDPYNVNVILLDVFSQIPYVIFTFSLFFFLFGSHWVSFFVFEFTDPYFYFIWSVTEILQCIFSVELYKFYKFWILTPYQMSHWRISSCCVGLGLSDLHCSCTSPSA